MLTLEGAETVELTLGEKYEEPGYTALDYKENDISKDVRVDMPDMGGVGEYEIKYSVTSHEITVDAVRKVVIAHKKPDNPGDNPYLISRVRINLGTDLETYIKIIR